MGMGVMKAGGGGTPYVVCYTTKWGALVWELEVYRPQKVKAFKPKEFVSGHDLPWTTLRITDLKEYRVVHLEPTPPCAFAVKVGEFGPGGVTL